ncbi:Galactose-binding-like_domain superfamily [Hexamita inflata]|uniref:Galactose-binding-like domain superfamily n=1 Tax=Hexamita inflata TaxID=28002 RepID=A0AA86PYX5_9EUKA|nr:Galactose-binding-like domain superfamily [Hexamita inflata]
MKALRMSYRVGATRTSSACRTKYNALQSYLDSPNGWVPSHPKDQEDQEVFIQTQFKSTTNIKKLIVKCQYESTTIKVQSSNDGIDFTDVRWEIWDSVQFVQDHFCQRFDSRSGLFLISYKYVIHCVIFTN